VAVDSVPMSKASGAWICQPSFRNSTPQGDLPFRVHVPHELDLKLLQRHVEVRPDHIVNGPDLAEQLGR
jgi:hypothetical protein